MGSSGSNQEINAKYYFHDMENISENSPVPGSFSKMDQCVSLSIELQNVDISSEHRVELITKFNDDVGYYNTKSDFTEKKQKKLWKIQ